MVFIDATEENPINYYNLIMNSNMLKMDGVICVQNVSANETRSQEHINDEMGLRSKEMTDVINADARVKQVSAIRQEYRMQCSGVGRVIEQTGGNI